jgi:nucleoside-diphosphate-sugar epimerase
MRILLIGADGFVGRNIAQVLRDEHEIFEATRSGKWRVDLLNKDSIAKALRATQPEVVINAAGVVDTTQDVDLNVSFSKNLLEQIAATAPGIKRVIITGSAAEYGIVSAKDIPVSEDTPRHATSGYGFSKLREVDTALELGKKYHVPIVVARLFNPIGPGMHPRFLVPKIIGQISEVNSGQQVSIDISRRESKRDYIDIRDIAVAYKLLAEKAPQHPVYNIGSGRSTTNEELVMHIVRACGIKQSPQINETALEAEPLIANQADITRIRTELGWEPRIGISESVKDIVSEISCISVFNSLHQPT